ncbi:helix-turn-helix domain-containing protein [Candidatus Finniella inopinata]|uniref:Transcriptional regulator n=1 Tax=Candidatus Finniella inopinata TaxID=1696036 RepID=A0A4Q7DLI0_9PROT|nr:transcriptional regulator [Candidatus Finniella inopinata]RZI47115.1 transcriptional regulator [Candidatus Finniella inopinata]
MEIRAVRTEEDYEWALAEIDQLMDAVFGTPEGDRLDVLATLVDAYEQKHFPIEDPDPVEAIKFRMEEEGLTPKDLVPYIGQRSHVYEVLNRKRALSMRMAQKLHHNLKIPARIFLQETA